MAFADDFKKGIERAIRIVQFDRPTMTEVAQDPGAFNVGIAIMAAAGLAQGIGSILHNPAAIILMPIVSVVGGFIGVGIVYLVGMLFKPPVWDFMQLFRVFSHVSLLGAIGIVGIIPFLGQLIMLVVLIYQLVVCVIVLETVAKLDRIKAIAVLLIPGVVCCGLVAMLFAFGLAAGLGLAGLGTMLGR